MRKILDVNVNVVSTVVCKVDVLKISVFGWKDVFPLEGVFEMMCELEGVTNCSSRVKVDTVSLAASRMVPVILKTPFEKEI